MTEITSEQRERIMLDVLQEIPAEAVENVLVEYYRRSFLAAYVDEDNQEAYENMAGIYGKMAAETIMQDLPAIHAMIDVYMNGMPDYA